MTAEAAVMNRLGVALAADSAVTVKFGPDHEKVYASSDKLFQLSKVAPVGVLVYGSADFVGLPWETIVKSYRRELGDRRFDTLGEYADSLFGFLRSNRRLFPVRAELQYADRLVMLLFYSIRRVIEAEIDKESEERDGLDDPDLPSIIDPVVRKRLEQIKSREVIATLGKDARARIQKRMGSRIRRIRDELFGTLPMLPATKRRLTSAAIEMFRRTYFGPALSGVVVAGFGEREYLPCSIQYELEEMVIGSPRCRLVERTAITAPENDAAVQAFAQQESVYLFFHGVDQYLERYLLTSTAELIRGLGERLLGHIEQADAELAHSLKGPLDKEVPRLIEGLRSDWDDRKRQYWAPIVQTVAALPKDELASMAQALVNLTKFRRRVTPESESVGGPIDVAVITKGDGFVWVDRKHYFDPVYNPRAIARYQREG